jgi:hypothetical protein
VKLTQVESLQDAEQAVRLIRMMNREDAIKAIRETLPPVKVRAFNQEAMLRMAQRDSRRPSGTV